MLDKLPRWVLWTLLPGALAGLLLVVGRLVAWRYAELPEETESTKKNQETAPRWAELLGNVVWYSSDRTWRENIEESKRRKSIFSTVAGFFFGG